MRKLTAAALMMLISMALSSCQGSAEEARAAQYSDVKVGLLFTTAGKGADLASASLGAAAVAADHLKQDHQVEVTIAQADYQSDLTTAATLARDLASKVDVLVVATDDAGIVGVLAGLDVPIIHAYVTADDATARSTVYRVAPSQSLQAQTLARFLSEERGYRRIALMTEKDESSPKGAASFSAALPSGTLVTNDLFEPGGDINSSVMNAADESADALVVWTDDPAEAARVTIEAHRQSMSYQLAISPDSAVPQFGKNAVAQVVPTAFREGILSVGPWAGPWTDSPQIRRFYRDFEAKQSDIAPVRAAQVYDSVLISSLAAGDGDVRSGLAGVRDFVGASVPISFDARREGMDESDLWAWAFTKSADGAGAEFFPAVDTGGGFFTLLPKGIRLPEKYRHLVDSP